MGSWEGLNRRKFPRANYPCLVVIRNQDVPNDGEDDKNSTILTHTDNVGVGGVCVILKQDLKMFSPVELELDLLDLGDHIRCNGKVVWNIRHQNEDGKKPNFYDIGIEFTDISTQDRARLEHIINRLVKNNG